MNNEMDFGQFISEKRNQQFISLSELADRLGITKAYLSQLEKGMRINPNAKLLEHLIETLSMSSEEAATMYMLYSKVSGQISPDIAEYILSNEYVQQAIRFACNVHATKTDWMRFVDMLKNEQ